MKRISIAEQEKILEKLLWMKSQGVRGFGLDDGSYCTIDQALTLEQDLLRRLQKKAKHIITS